MTNKTEDKFYFGNIGTKAESELTVRITKMLGEVERAVLSRNQEKAKSIASKVREMIRKSANTSTAKMQMDELNSIMLGVSFSREGKSERFGMAEQVMRDGSVHLDFSAARDYLAKQSDEGLRYIIKDAKSARDAMGTAGRKFHYYTDLVLEAQQELKKRGFSRPGQPDVMATPIGEHGAIGKLVSRAIQEGAAAYRAGKPAVLNARDPKYKGMSEKELEIYGNFWMRGWDGERIKDASAKPIRRGIDLPGMRFSRPGQPERFADGTESFLTIKGVRYRIVGTRKDARGNLVYDLHGTSKTAHPVPFTLVKFLDDGRWVLWGAHGGEVSRGKIEASRPVQPERFAANGWQTIEAYTQVLAEEFGTPRGKEAAQVMMRAAESLGGNAPAALRTAIRTAATSKNATDRGRAIGQIEDMLESASFSRPGQPETFASKKTTAGALRKQLKADGFTDPSDWEWHGIAAVDSDSTPYWLHEDGSMEKIRSSRPAQPERFDASSLNRGNFAEASSSPMLGKLLSEKVMPEGGWRAVETSGGALVISFEDADLARNFGRRVATKGYNATSPVATTGRYWNVEVKNDGK